jgi:electron transfer flavoprotein beta subunit
MNIVVCVKQVPDTAAERKLKSDGTLDRASVDGLINELDEYAIEEGLRIAEAQREAGGEAEVTILTMGPQKAAESIRKALSMGADKGVHLLDDQVSLAMKVVDIDESTIRIRRLSDDGYYEVEASLPAVISVVEKINEPRYPSFKGIMAAKKKPVQTLSLADAGTDAAEVGLGGSVTEVADHAERPPRQAGVVVKDEGDGGVKVAEFLAARKFI